MKAPPAEYDRPLAGLSVRPLGFPDPYAPMVGHAGGWPVGYDPESGRAWLAHCYAMVGVGRDLAPDTGTGGELYAVIGHAPRHLDLNIALIGRVVEGIGLFEGAVGPDGEVARGTTWIVNPGLRAALNFGGLQVVPGLALPITRSEGETETGAARRCRASSRRGTPAGAAADLPPAAARPRACGCRARRRSRARAWSATAMPR